MAPHPPNSTACGTLVSGSKCLLLFVYKNDCKGEFQRNLQTLTLFSALNLSGEFFPDFARLCAKKHNLKLTSFPKMNFALKCSTRREIYQK